MRVCEKISTMTDRRRGHLSLDEMVEQLNRVLSGWANYFCLGPVSDTYRKVNAHVRYRLRRWWSAKHKHKRKVGPKWYWSPWLEETFGLLQLKWTPSRLPHANV